MASTWRVFGATLATFWSFFGCSCGISTEEEFEDVFLPIFHRLAIRAILKNTAPADELEYFCFFILFGHEIDSGPFLGCFGVPKSFQKRPKKRLQRCFKSSQFFGACLSPQKLFFWPTWPQHGPKINPPAPPSWAKNRSKIGPKTVSGAKSAPEPILGRFLVDF